MLSFSPFMHLYNARQDDALITMTGFNFAAFSFPRLRDPMRHDDLIERKFIITLCVRLFNQRAAVVGQNQIRSTFMLHLDANANTYIS